MILNTETGIAKELGFSPELVKQLIEYSGSDAEQQQKLTVQLSRYFFDLSEPNYEENAYKRSRRLLNLLKMTKIVIDKGETENFQSSTLQSVISQI
ncbi:MAG TPA: hypothetical protein PK390_02230 [Fervidobacterium nodosum]|nr:hypothetical protein [Fervidobacterium nodosum]